MRARVVLGVVVVVVAMLAPDIAAVAVAISVGVIVRRVIGVRVIVRRVIGVRMLAMNVSRRMPVIMGVQFILGFLNYDIASVPTRPLHKKTLFRRRSNG